MTFGRRLPSRELRRKIFHILLGTSFLIVLDSIDRAIYGAMALLFAGILLSALHGKFRIRPVSWILARFDREGDRMAGMGIITFFLGVVLTWLIFPREAAIAGIAVMTFGDPLASVIGITLGSHHAPWNEKKTLEGTGAFVAAAFLALLPTEGVLVAATGAFGGAIVESFKHPKGSVINDNVTIPLGAAAAVYLVTWIF